MLWSRCSASPCRTCARRLSPRILLPIAPVVQPRLPRLGPCSNRSYAHRGHRWHRRPPALFPLERPGHSFLAKGEVKPPCRVRLLADAHRPCRVICIDKAAPGTFSAMRMSELIHTGFRCASSLVIICGSIRSRCLSEITTFQLSDQLAHRASVEIRSTGSSHPLH
ncbi:unnamed protein product [Mycena citricolor]|uniref:Uncharacterized protein n=1 Tax=Mycena citricolor TaxID=2018698 RepID=A0AAD2HXL9_9AGAR|nr:unnamed protein product [Mycena citricolor]